ncbi:hypothetical protein J4050_12355 [Winogradskyella sp. DF17]|uniref:Uncharacterized protein n=1 Tax=Winogradskyella pelagia TaxID=2819984 RepID=A0ABS3T539_9FLAO|nr:hypothetical protein [Winogradskyella sp. DF17]MBO3117544.1 hypothetical protein [Winogradskyella sp. DF17]
MSTLTNPHQHNTDVDGSDVNFSTETLKTNIALTPLKHGGSSFKTHVLIRVSDDIFSYKPSYGTAIFCWVFVSIGLSLLFFGVREILVGISEVKFPVLLLVGIGLIFTSVGAYMFYSFYKPIVFDKSKGLYRKGYNTKKRAENVFKSAQKIRLIEIIAFQIIGERVKGDKNTFNSFELNMVLKNGKRKNIVDHGNLKSIINDAQSLSEFLDVPIWHAKSKEISKTEMQ